MGKKLFSLFILSQFLLQVVIANTFRLKKNVHSGSKTIDGFIENKGQFIDMQGRPVPTALFKAATSDMDVYITEHGITYLFKEIDEKKEAGKGFPRTEKPHCRIKSFRIDATITGANIKKENIEYLEQNDNHYNYFYPHCPKGLYNVKEYRKIRFREIYSGINWVIYVNERGVKYDFEVSANADYQRIQIVYQGANEILQHKDGSIEIKTPMGSIRELTPITYQNNKEIYCSFKVYEKNKVRFNLRDYSSSLPLLIDPQLSWGTLYGGNSSEEITSITTDTIGNIYVTGQTLSSNFPTQNAGTYFDSTLYGAADIFLLKFNTAETLLWATYYGGNDADVAQFVATDLNGNICLTGHTSSTDFPVQNSGAYFDSIFNGISDAFIIKFDKNGNRVWSTYYGGSNIHGSDGLDEGQSITIDSKGNLFVTGHTHTFDFPVRNSGFYFNNIFKGSSDVFILKFDNSDNLVWATYYGGANNEEASGIRFYASKLISLLT